MNINKILPMLKGIEDMVSQVRDLLFCPEGIRIVSLWREDLSYVEYWDGDMSPRIVGMMEKKVDEFTMQQWIFDAVGSIPPSLLMDPEEREIVLLSDIDLHDLSIGVQAATDLFKIKFTTEIKDELINQIRSRHDFNNHLSQLKSTPSDPECSTSVHGDNELPDTRPST